MGRFSILVIEYGSNNEIELCRVDRNPHAIAQAAVTKTLRIKGGNKSYLVPKYNSVRVRDNEPPEAE